MEDDKELRKLLSEGALVKASADFYNKVMAGISEQPAPLVYIEKWKHLLKTLAAVLIMIVIVLSFFINPNALPFSLIKELSRIPTTYLVTITEYLVAFWVLITISFWMNKSAGDSFSKEQRSFND